MILPVVALVSLLSFQSVVSDQVTCTSSSTDPSQIGIVLLHAKTTFSVSGHGGSPAYDATIAPLASALRSAGFRVAVPEMPWSRDHVYDRTFAQALDEIASAAAKLQAEGAKRIVVAGHSMGGMAAIGYAALKGGVAGVVAIAPAHDPAAPVFKQRLGDSVASARDMAAAGKGDVQATFGDFNMGQVGQITTTAKNYLTFFDPEGDVPMPRNAARFAGPIPLLWIVAADDPLSRLGPSYAFAKAPPDPLSRFMTVSGGHVNAPAAAADLIVTWLKCL